MFNMVGKRFAFNIAYSKWMRWAIPTRSIWMRNTYSKLTKSFNYQPRLISHSNIRTFCQAKSDQEAVEFIEAKVFEVLKSAAKWDISKLNRAATFQDLGFDSLDTVEIIVAIEEHIGFDISNDDAERINGVLDCIQAFYDTYIKRQQPVKEPAEDESKE